jgi:Do/DeqQ family serine protease
MEDVTPGVVNIATRGHVRIERTPFFDDPGFREFFENPSLRRFFNLPEEPVGREVQSIGSGVIVDAEEGYVLTNHHVIAQADDILVTLKDGRRVEAKLLGSDPGTDIAVLRIEPERLHSVPLGNSEELEVGDFVVAIGNPFGLGQTVTMGIVSALGRHGLRAEGYEDFIQTDASINPGNSGGALVDLQGRLVGINTAIIGPAGGNIGIGFAIPVNIVHEVMDQIVAFGVVRRGRLGVLIRDLTPEPAQGLGIDTAKGVIIEEVVPDSAADRAGIQPGDVILRVNGEEVVDSAALRTKIGLSRVGEVVRLEVLRGDRKIQVAIQIEEAPTQGE